MERDGAFDDYMGVQYREGKAAYTAGELPSANPYNPSSEMSKAWTDGYQEECLKENSTHKLNCS